MEAAGYRHAASVDPVQGIRNTVELILRVYGTSREELEKRGRPTQITITKYKWTYFLILTMSFFKLFLIPEK